MKSQKPKGKTPSLISSTNGKPTPVKVQRKGKCSRCKSDIENGVNCFEIPKIGLGYKKRKRVCKICFINIIQQTEKDLTKIKNLM